MSYNFKAIRPVMPSKDMTYNQKIRGSHIMLLKVLHLIFFQSYNQNYKQILLRDQRKWISLISEVYLKKSYFKIKYLNYLIIESFVQIFAEYGMEQYAQLYFNKLMIIYKTHEISSNYEQQIL
ncbi:hypothetical protein pb186bvf_001450 [Paramecium bursaria]